MFCIIPLQSFGNSDVYKNFIQLSKLDLVTEDEHARCDLCMSCLFFVQQCQRNWETDHWCLNPGDCHHHQSTHIWHWYDCSLESINHLGSGFIEKLGSKCTEWYSWKSESCSTIEEINLIQYWTLTSHENVKISERSNLLQDLDPSMWSALPGVEDYSSWLVARWVCKCHCHNCQHHHCHNHNK